MSPHGLEVIGKLLLRNASNVHTACARTNHGDHADLHGRDEGYSLWMTIKG